MNDIHRIYQNNFGIAFQWKKDLAKDILKVQVVFKDNGLLLSKEELIQFSKNIKHTQKHYSLCNDCPKNENCRGMVIAAPNAQITFAVNVKELHGIQDLIEGTLFQMNLENYLGDICNKN